MTDGFVVILLLRSLYITLLFNNTLIFWFIEGQIILVQRNTFSEVLKGFSDCGVFLSSLPRVTVVHF